MTDQTTDTTKVQLGEPMNFIGVTYQNTREELFTEAEVTPRQLHHQGHPSMPDIAQELGNLEHRAQPGGRYTGWRVAFTRASDLNLSWASQLVSVSSRPLPGLSHLCSLTCVRVALSSFYCLVWEEGLSASVWSASGTC